MLEYSRRPAGQDLNRALSRADFERLQAQGEADSETWVGVSLMIYYTREFRNDFDNEDDFNAFMEEVRLLFSYLTANIFDQHEFLGSP